MSDKEKETGIDPKEIWMLRSAYLKYVKSDWRNLKSIKMFLESPELEVLIKSGKYGKLKEVVKFFSASEMNKDDVKKLMYYFDKKIFKEQKAD